MKTTASPKRRWLQFSLRTLFILTALLAVWLGFYVKRVRDQRETVAAILKAGGTVAYDYQSPPKVSPGGPLYPTARPPGPSWLRNLIGEDYFVTVVHFRFLDWRQNQLVVDWAQSRPKLQSVSLDPGPKDRQFAQIEESLRKRGVEVHRLAIWWREGLNL